MNLSDVGLNDMHSLGVHLSAGCGYQLCWGTAIAFYMIALLCEAGEFDPRERNAANLFHVQAVQQGSPLCKTAFK